MKRLYGVCAMMMAGFLSCFVEANSPPAQTSQNMTPPPPLFVVSPQAAAIACMVSPSAKKNALIASRKRAGSMPDIHEEKAAREVTNVKTAPSTATATSKGSPHAKSSPIPIPARSQSVTPRGAMKYGATAYVFAQQTSPLGRPLTGQQSPAAVAQEVQQFKIMIGALQEPFMKAHSALMGMKSKQGSWSDTQHIIDHNELADLLGRADVLLAKYRAQ